MVFCMAFGCSNASDKKGRKSKGIRNVSFHRLPLNNKDLLKKWVAAMKLEKPHINIYSRVCSDHFEKEMFEDDSVKASIVGAKSRPTRRLKPNAVPKQFVFSKAVSQASQQRQERQKLLTQKRWPKTKNKTINLENLVESENAELMSGSTVDTAFDEKSSSDQMEIPVEVCSCRHGTKISKSTQTDTLADQLKIQHDHSYAKIIRTDTTKTKTTTSKCKLVPTKKSASSPKKQPSVEKEPELEYSDVDHSDSDTDCEPTVDSEYEPSSSSDESDSSKEDDNTSSNNNDAVFLVYQSSLDKLFETCSICGSILEVTKFFRGTMVVYEWICHNNHRGRWESQPVIRDMPQGNLDLAGGILFTGGTYTKVFDIAKTMKLKIFSERHFMNIQRSYLFPAVDELYKEIHLMWIDAFRYQHVFVGGDGRSDTPGHNAKYLTYSFMEEHSELILHFELVQVTEAPGQASTNMERLGFTRALDYMLGEDVIVDGVTTDRHPQISCDMNKLYPEVKHEFDIFHVAKNVNKKLRAKAKKKDCEALLSWIPSINLHLWWCCASCNGNYTELKDKWLSLLNHVCNIHEWASADNFHKCSHAPLQAEDVHEISWLTPDSPALNALRCVVTHSKLLKDMKKMTLFKHTGSLEVFHSMLLKYCPKREHFSYEGMRARIQLSVMDHNENVGREQATTDDGTLRFGLAFPKRKKQWVVKKVYTKKTFSFRERLMDSVRARRNDKDIVLGERYVGRPDLPKNIASNIKPSKEDTIEAFRTRFELA